MDIGTAPVERKDTAIRILLTVLFCLIVQVTEAVLGVVVLFELAYALVTGNAPGERVRGFANRALSYLYRILRYLTYNEAEPPFPFADFPPEVEPPASAEKPIG